MDPSTRGAAIPEPDPQKADDPDADSDISGPLYTHLCTMAHKTPGGGRHGPGVFWHKQEEEEREDEDKDEDEASLLPPPIETASGRVCGRQAK